MVVALSALLAFTSSPCVSLSTHAYASLSLPPPYTNSSLKSLPPYLSNPCFRLVRVSPALLPVFPTLFLLFFYYAFDVFCPLYIVRSAYLYLPFPPIPSCSFPLQSPSFPTRRVPPIPTLSFSPLSSYPLFSSSFPRSFCLHASS